MGALGRVPYGEYLELREAGGHGGGSMEGAWGLALPWEEK